MFSVYLFAHHLDVVLPNETADHGRNYVMKEMNFQSEMDSL